MEDSAIAISEYGKPAPLTMKSVELLPSTGNPHLGVKVGGREVTSVRVVEVGEMVEALAN
jgi:hypothetical protein